MKIIRRGLVAVLLAAVAVSAPAVEVVVLKGGTVVPLKEHWVRRGNTAYLTRADGTLLSVPVSEIDRDKTAAANHVSVAAPAPAAAPAPSTPADAARVPKDTPKAKVRITDADVSHPLDLDTAAAGEEKKDAGVGGTPKVEIADYTQETNGDTLRVRGSLRNPGQGVAEGVRLQISAIDEKGQPIDGTTASLSKGSIEPGQTVDFNGSLKIGERTVASLRFAPQWAAPKPMAPPAAAGARPAVPAAATGGGSPSPLRRRTAAARCSLLRSPMRPRRRRRTARRATSPAPRAPTTSPSPPSR